LRGADEPDSSIKIQNASTKVGGMAGGFIGSEIGALIGTAILPGVGSVLGAIIGGELGGKTGRVRVHSVAKTIANDKSSNQLGFKAFDLVQEGDRKYHGEPYEEKLQRMAEIFKGGKRVNVAPISLPINPPAMPPTFVLAFWILMLESGSSAPLKHTNSSFRGQTFHLIKLVFTGRK
jgi:hypothetical protein